MSNVFKKKLKEAVGLVNVRYAATGAAPINPDILKLCKYMPELAYIMGGGSIKDWKNPFLKESGNFMKCYGNSDMIREKDGTGRTIWYRPEHQWKKIDEDQWDHYSGLPNPKYYS